MSNIICT